MFVSKQGVTNLNAQLNGFGATWGCYVFRGPGSNGAPRKGPAVLGPLSAEKTDEIVTVYWPLYCPLLALYCPLLALYCPLLAPTGPSTALYCPLLAPLLPPTAPTGPPTAPYCPSLASIYLCL